jgi:hypothetical protein
MVVKVIIHPVCLNLGIHFTSCYHSLGFVGANFRAEVSTGKNPSKKKRSTRLATATVSGEGQPGRLELNSASTLTEILRRLEPKRGYKL